MKLATLQLEIFPFFFFQKTFDFCSRILRGKKHVQDQETRGQRRFRGHQVHMRKCRRRRALTKVQTRLQLRIARTYKLSLRVAEFLTMRGIIKKKKNALYFFLARDFSKAQGPRDAGSLARLRGRSVRSSHDRGHQVGAQGPQALHTAADFLGPLRPAGLEVDLPSHSDGRRDFRLHPETRSVPGGQSALHRPVHSHIPVRRVPRDREAALREHAPEEAHGRWFPGRIGFRHFRLSRVSARGLCVRSKSILVFSSFQLDDFVFFQKNTYVKLPEPGYTQVRLFNTIPCQADLYIKNMDKTIVLESLGVWEDMKFPAKDKTTIWMNITYKECNVDLTEFNCK